MSSTSSAFDALRRLALVALAMQAAAPAGAATAPTDLHCPATLARMPVADDVPPGWIMHARPARTRLQRAAFYDGDPAGLATLAPDATRRSGRLETSTWNLGHDSANVWLACLYGDTTTVVARPLPPGLRQCTTVLKLTALGDPSEPVSVACR